jgi:hypothetical protein
MFYYYRVYYEKRYKDRPILGNCNTLHLKNDIIYNTFHIEISDVLITFNADIYNIVN